MVYCIKKIKEMPRPNRLELISIRSRKSMNSLNRRFSSTISPNTFRSKTRKTFKTTDSLQALIDNNGAVKDVDAMLSIAATHYENLLAEPSAYRPHPYADSPEENWDNRCELIPPVTISGLLKVIGEVKIIHSADAHGIAPHMLIFIPNNYMVSPLNIFNNSISSFSGPSYWEHIKMKLLAKRVNMPYN